MSESQAHIELKSKAKNWLKQEHGFSEKNIHEEHYDSGYIIDVVGENNKKSVAVECGYIRGKRKHKEEKIEHLEENYDQYKRFSYLKTSMSCNLDVRNRSQKKSRDFYDRKVPDEFYNCYKELINHGFSPSTASATLYYFNTKESRSKIADEFTISSHSITRVKKFIVKNSLLDESDIEKPKDETQKDILEDLADILGLENGEDYTIKESRYGTYRTRLNKKGMAKIRNSLEELILENQTQKGDL